MPVPGGAEVQWGCDAPGMDRVWRGGGAGMRSMNGRTFTGRFVLRLVKDRPDQKVSLCMDGFKKTDALTYLLEKTNFTPTQDLKVAFIGY
jgi:uncharacterized protein DUF4424